jgi:cell volume regulation protein A
VSTSDLGLILLVGAAVVLAAIVAARVAHGIGLPVLLLFLGLGLALGEAGAGVRFDNAGLAQSLGLSALVLILAEGGLTTSWTHARAAAPAALSLATVGVVASVLVVSAAARWLVGLGWRDALLLGAVLAPTDAAAVFSVLRKLPLPPRLSGTLEGESGLNDPPAVLAVTLLSEAGHHQPSAALIAGEVVYELAAGAAIGFVVGVVARRPCGASRCRPRACTPSQSSRSSWPATGRRRWPTRAGSSRCTCPRWSWATPGSPTVRPSAASLKASPGWARSACS